MSPINGTQPCPQLLRLRDGADWVYNLKFLTAGSEATTTTCVGTTSWRSLVDGQAAILTWEWVKVRENVFALADPMSVHANFFLVDDAGDELPPPQATIQLAGIVNSLPWQRFIKRTLKGYVITTRRQETGGLAADAAPRMMRRGPAIGAAPRVPHHRM